MPSRHVNDVPRHNQFRLATAGTNGIPGFRQSICLTYYEHVELLGWLQKSQEFGFLGPGEVERQVEHAEGLAESLARAEPGQRMLDLGSGGGIPGLVLFELVSGLTGALLESQQKRCEFLRDAVDGLGLVDRVRVLPGRAENLARVIDLEGTFDVVTARSFGPPAVVGECAARFLKIGGLLWVSEPPLSDGSRWSGVGQVGMKLDQVASLGTGSWARLVKTSATPEKFPRRDGRPAKAPLW